MALIIGEVLYQALNRVQQLMLLEVHRNAAPPKPAQYRFKPLSLVYNALFERVLPTQAVKNSPVGVKKPDVIRILNKYLSNEDGTSVGSSTLHRMELGQQKKEFTVDSWEQLGELIVYELRSEANYLKEIELAEVALASPVVEQAYNKAYKLLHACIRHSLDLLPALTKKLPSKKAVIEDLGYNAVVWFQDNKFDLAFKHYRAFYPELENMSLYSASMKDEDELELDQKIALVHDMLQVLWDIYKVWIEEGLAVSALWPGSLGSEHPLSRDVKTQTGVQTWGLGRLSWQAPVMERRREKGVDDRSKKFAKSEGRPSEAGPSYTTVRFCGINTMVSTLQHVSGKLGVKMPERIAALGKDELVGLVWGIFAFWSLRYRKSIGPAHCFFEIREAAAQCGVELAKGDGYPEKGGVKVALKSKHAPNLTSNLRRRALLAGLEQSIIADYSKLDATTKQAFESPVDNSMAGVKVRQTLPNPFTK